MAQLSLEDLVAIRGAALAAQAAAPGIWAADSLKVGDHGDAYMTYSLFIDSPRDGGEALQILTADNSDNVLLEEERGGDENGEWCDVWDANGHKVIDFVEKAQPAAVISMVDELQALREENASLRQRNRDLLRANSVSHDRIVGFRAAMERVCRWQGEFPETGKTWDDGSPVSYATLYGSDGERDFMRGVLQEALRRYLPGKSYQQRIAPWMLACFNEEIAADMVERGDRLLEEVLELLQSNGYDPARVPMIHRYVFGRAVGETFQEVGGVMVCLAAYCNAVQVDMQHAAETELARIWTKIEQIRAKQLTKPKGAPEPVPVGASVQDKLLETARDFLALVGDSEGVTGYHKNGDVAEWDEFDLVNLASGAVEAAEAEWRPLPQDPEG